MWDNTQQLQENGGVWEGEGEMDRGFTFIKKRAGEPKEIRQNVNINFKWWVHGCLLYYFLYICNISQIKVKYYFKKNKTYMKRCEMAFFPLRFEFPEVEHLFTNLLTILPSLL